MADGHPRPTWPYLLGYGTVAVLLGLAVWIGVHGLPAASSPSVAASGSATPTLPAPMASPAKPERWSDTGPDGAVAAAQWFMGPEYEYMFQTNDVSEWQRLSEPGCVFCSDRAATAKKNATNGYVAYESSTIITSLTRVEELNPLSYSVLLHVNQPAVVFYTTDGASAGVQDASATQLLVVLDRVGHDWVVAAVQHFDISASVPPIVTDAP